MNQRNMNPATIDCAECRKSSREPGEGIATNVKAHGPHCAVQYEREISRVRIMPQRNPTTQPVVFVKTSPSPNPRLDVDAKELDSVRQQRRPPVPSQKLPPTSFILHKVFGQAKTEREQTARRFAESSPPKVIILIALCSTDLVASSFFGAGYMHQ
jgi:hypothetical protein